MCSDNTEYLLTCKTKVDELYSLYVSDPNTKNNTQKQNDAFLVLVTYADTFIEMANINRIWTDNTNTHITEKQKEKYIQDLNVDEINRLYDKFESLQETVTPKMIVIYNFLHLKKCVAMKGVYKVNNIDIQEIVNIHDELFQLVYYLTPEKCIASNNNINSLVLMCAEVHLFLNPPEYAWKSNVEAELKSRIENDDTIFTTAKTKIDACFKKLNVCNSEQAQPILTEIQKILLEIEINVETYTHMNYNIFVVSTTLVTEIVEYIKTPKSSSSECDNNIQKNLLVRQAQAKCNKKFVNSQ